MPGAALVLGGLLLAWPQLGCVAVRQVSHTPRTATEQLLVSEAVERAVADLAWPELSGRRISIATVSLVGADADYLRAVAEARARALGARIVEPAEAELRFELLVGMLGTVFREAEFGIPSLPTPFGVTTPSIPFFKAVRQHGWVKLRSTAHDGEGSHRFESDPLVQHTRFDVYSVFFFAYRSNDVYPDGSGFGID